MVVKTKECRTKRASIRPAWEEIHLPEPPPWRSARLVGINYPTPSFPSMYDSRAAFHAADMRFPTHVYMSICSKKLAAPPIA